MGNLFDIMTPEGGHNIFFGMLFIVVAVFLTLILLIHFGYLKEGYMYRENEEKNRLYKKL